MSVEKRIDKVVSIINENPLLYHRKADIRAMLYDELVLFKIAVFILRCSN